MIGIGSGSIALALSQTLIGVEQNAEVNIPVLVEYQSAFLHLVLPNFPSLLKRLQILFFPDNNDISGIPTDQFSAWRTYELNENIKQIWKNNYNYHRYLAFTLIEILNII